jgi:hypothetical protein
VSARVSESLLVDVLTGYAEGFGHECLQPELDLPHRGACLCLHVEHPQNQGTKILGVRAAHVCT